MKGFSSAYILPCSRCFPRRTSTDDGFNGDVGRIYLLRELTDGLIGILVGVRVDVGPDATTLREQRRRHCNPNNVNLVHCYAYSNAELTQVHIF